MHVLCKLFTEAELDLAVLCMHVAGMKASGGATACMEKVYTKTFMERVGMESFITAQVLV